MSASPFCRDCGRLIEWHPTAGGKRMPIDPDPHPEGTFAFDPAMKLVRREKGSRQRMFRCHFDTCPKKEKAAARRAAWTCDREGCEVQGFHRHCFRCGTTDHLATECTEETPLDENGDPTW